MAETFVLEWLGSSTGSVGLSVVAPTVIVISKMRETMDGGRGMGEAEVQGGGEEPIGVEEEVRKNNFTLSFSTLTVSLLPFSNKQTGGRVGVLRRGGGHSTVREPEGGFF